MRERRGMLVPVGFIVTLAVSLLCATPQGAGVPEEQVNRGSLSWYAAQAKARGKTKIVIPAPLGIPAAVNSLDEAFSSAYTAVLARPVALKTYADKWEISTWYKFEIVEILVAKPSREGAPERIPQDFLPLSAGEFVLKTGNGTAHVDGIEITSKGDLPDFSFADTYLLFVEPDSSGNLVFLPLGDDGVFLVKANGTLESASTKDTSLKRDVSLLFNTMDRFRSEIKLHRLK